jgi:hypothetical protein
VDQFTQVRGFAPGDRERCPVKRLQGYNESAVTRLALIFRREFSAIHTHSTSYFLSVLDLGDGATIFGAKREMDRIMNGIPITVGSTQNVICGSWLNSGIK